MVIKPPPAQVRPGTNTGYSHLLHVALDSLTVDIKTFPTKLGGNAPGAIEGTLGVNFVDMVLEGDFFW